MKRCLGPIEGPRTRLRLLEEADLPMTLAWRNQDEVRRWFLHSDVITPAEHRAWYQRYTERDDDFVFVIEETVDLRKPVGQVALYRIDWRWHRAEYGRLLIGEPEARRRGLAGEATRLILDYAFGSLELAEIELVVYGDNRPALAIYRACGFREVADRDGRLRMIKTLEGLVGDAASPRLPR